MANIKIGELREALKLNQNENIKVVDYNGLKIEIKQYIPILDKIALVSSIYESAVNTDNGLHIISGNSVDIAFKNLLVQTYTNLTLPQTKNEEGNKELNAIESYDLLCKSGLYDFIYENIPANEILDIQMALNNLIQSKQDEYDQSNKIKEQKLKIENIIKDGVDGLLLRFDEFIKKLPEKHKWDEISKNLVGDINNIDPTALKFISQAIGWNKGGL